MGDKNNIILMPNEVIWNIISKCEIRDIVRFSGTCKYLSDLIINYNYIWKCKFTELLSKPIQEDVAKHQRDVIWLDELKQFFMLKNFIRLMLSDMSRFYWSVSDITSEILDKVFRHATKTPMSYYYMTYILRDIIKTTKNYVNKNTCQQPMYTLTSSYYAKVLLSHLVHTFLSIKWIERDKRCDKLPPKVVLTFFLQWIDPEVYYSDEEVDEKICHLLDQVKSLIKEDSTDKEIVGAITEVMYKREKFTLSIDKTILTLSLVEVIKNKHGHKMALASIFLALGKSLGVNCDLHTFADHFYVEWICKEDGVDADYIVDLATGEYRLKRRCPYSRRSYNRFDYVPYEFLKYIFAECIERTVLGVVRMQFWDSRTTAKLYEFLTSMREEAADSTRNFFKYLVESVRAPVDWEPTLNSSRLEEKYMQLISSAPHLHEPPEPTFHNVVKIRSPDLVYSVGMVCYHLQYYYMCVIRDWEVDDDRKPTLDDASYGKGPVYIVISEDRREKCVPQEKINRLSQPRRIPAIEDVIGKHFTHFNGRIYVANDQKRLEYPEDIDDNSPR